MFDQSIKMKQLFQQYAAYNLWANKRIIETANKLSDEQIHKEIVSSFPSVYKTFIHLLEVENVWLERLQDKNDMSSGWFTGNFEELSNKLLSFSKQWCDWVEQKEESYFYYVFTYRNSLGQQFKQPVYEILLHFFNHQTFHRGQLVTMLRQLGIDKISPTDFIVFTRGK